MAEQGWVRRSKLPELYPVPLGTWNRWAGRGEGPSYARVGKHALYRLEDVEAWLESQKRGAKVARET